VNHGDALLERLQSRTLEPIGHRRLRILHVIIFLGPTNGQYNQHCLPLRRERDFSICTYFKPSLEPPAEIKVYAGDGSMRGFFRALGAALRTQDYDIVHVHAPETGPLVLLGLALRPHRWRVWRSLVYTVTDSFYDYDARDKISMLPTFAAFRRVVFCSHAARDSFPALWSRMAGARSRTVQNAADVDRVERAIAGRPRGRSDSRFNVVTVGRLEEVKDPMTLLAAFRLIVDEGTHLTFIGAGSLEGKVVGEIRASLPQGRVELTGLISRDEVFVRCHDADLFVSASLGEGLPVAVIEAMATGCPVVLSDIPPHRELADGASFIPLVPCGDAEAIAREIDRFRSMSPEARAKVGRRCREHVRTRFDLATMQTNLENVYHELL
jgi:glycosyltransferase involved in cell wall biosynthesis